MDGVLVDSAEDHRQSWRALGGEIGVAVGDAELAAVFGRQNRDIIPILFGDGRTPEEIRELGYRKELLYRDRVRGRVPVRDGAGSLVRSLHENGYALAVGSSAPRANIDLALLEMGVTDLFLAIVASEDVSIGKPDPGVFLTAACRLGMKPADCLVIEDAPAGVDAARAAGMPVVAVLGSHPADRLAHANRVVEHLGELMPTDGSFEDLGG